MSNSTRQGGYDERLVVPLEASRRGAHRARVSPLVAALPLLAVVVVVAAVIGVAYTLFLRPSTKDVADPGAGGPTTSATAPASPRPGGSASQPAPSGGASSGSSATTTAAGAAVDKTVAFQVYNGSVPKVNGLAGDAATKLKGGGFTGAAINRGAAPVPAKRTTVYYASADQAATAKAIAKALGVGAAKESASIAASGIVVIVVNDFQP